MVWIVIIIIIAILTISIVSVITMPKASKITIGRNPSSDIMVEDKYKDVSVDHAVIFYDRGQLIFEDTSTNGSKINGEEIYHANRIIRPDDVITLGTSYVLPWSKIDDKLKTKYTGTLPTRTINKKIT